MCISFVKISLDSGFAPGPHWGQALRPPKLARATALAINEGLQNPSIQKS